MSYRPATDLLNNKVILVTGAGSGIGATVAKAYAAHGATVVMLDKNIAKLEQVYDEIVAAQHPAPALYPLDLKGASITDYDDLVVKVTENFGRLDGLVHCAASLGQLAPVQNHDTKIWLETLHINLTAAYLLTCACLPSLQKQDNAAIIFTTDSHKDKAYWAGYGVSKAAIETFSKQLSDELESESRIRVNTIDPGQVQTKLHSQAFPAIDPSSLAKPDDIVGDYLYLMGDDSLAITGALIHSQ